MMIITAEWKVGSTANFEQHVFIITIVIRPQSHGMKTNVLFLVLPCSSPLDPAQRWCPLCGPPLNGDVSGDVGLLIVPCLL